MDLEEDFNQFLKETSNPSLEEVVIVKEPEVDLPRLYEPPTAVIQLPIEEDPITDQDSDGTGSNSNLLRPPSEESEEDDSSNIFPSIPVCYQNNVI